MCPAMWKTCRAQEYLPFDRNGSSLKRIAHRQSIERVEGTTSVVERPFLKALYLKEAGREMKQVPDVKNTDATQNLDGGKCDRWRGCDAGI